MGQIGTEPTGDITSLESYLKSNQNSLDETESKRLSVATQTSGNNEATKPERKYPQRWVKGQSGNPSGRPRTKPITDAFKDCLDNPRTLKALARKVIKKSGIDARMLEQVLDRVEGKVVQQIDLNATIGIAERISRARTRQSDEVIEVEADSV